MALIPCPVCKEGVLARFEFKEKSVGDLSSKFVYACTNPNCQHIIQVKWAEGKGYFKTHHGINK